MRFTAALAPLAVLAASPALAGMPVEEEKICPIGGERFRHVTTHSYTIFGYRPDGKPFGSWQFPLALPVCPTNGLVVYREFSEEELARLRPLVASPEYRALLQDTPYYRAHWLLRELGAEPATYLWALAQAGWEADDDPELRRRYLAELAQGVQSHMADVRDIGDLAMRARAINALRELGRFEDAIRLWEATSLDPFQTALDDPEEERNRAGWLDYYRRMRVLIDRGDASAEPFDMMPRRFSIGRCIDDADALSAHHRAFCEEAAGEVEQMRGDRAEFERRMER